MRTINNLPTQNIFRGTNGLRQFSLAGESHDFSLKPLWLSAAQHINFISPENAENGDPQNPKSGWAGKFREVQGFCRISTETLGPGNPRKFIFGTPFLAIWGDFRGEMRMAKVDMLGRGEIRSGPGKPNQRKVSS